MIAQSLAKEMLNEILDLECEVGEVLPLEKLRDMFEEYGASIIVEDNGIDPSWRVKFPDGSVLRVLHPNEIVFERRYISFDRKEVVVTCSTL